MPVQNNKTELSNVENIKIMPLLDVMKEQAPNFRNTNISLIIVEFENFGRAKHDCKKGFGLCRAKWFPQFRSTQEVDSEKYGAIVQEDAINKTKYIDILLEKIPTSNFIIDDVIYSDIRDVDFIIDIDIYLDESSYLKAGNYSYRSDIGKHGGFRILLEEHDHE